MDDVGRSILWFVLAALFLGIAALISAANEAYDDAGVSRLRKLYEDENNVAAGKLLQLQSKVQPYALKVNLCGAFPLLTSMTCMLFGLLSLTTVWWKLLIGWVIGVWLILFLGLALPRVLSENNPTGFVLKIQGLLRFLVGLFTPFASGVHALSILSAKHGEEQADEDERTEEEIRLLVAAGTDSGAIEESENEMIDNIFEFDDRTVGEVMTHRTDVCAVEESADLSEILDIALREGVSRIPVYRDRIDKVIGVLYVKDLLELLSNPQRTFCLEEFIRPVLYIPEQTMCNSLFCEFQQKKIHFAIVVDEYGGTAGVVTMEDLLEAIVGNIQDEYDHEEDMIYKNNDGSYFLHGDIEIDRAAKELDTTFPEADSADTLGGVVINLLQRIPEEDEKPSVVVDGWTLHVTRVTDRHIEQIHAVPVIEDPEEDEKAESLEKSKEKSEKLKDKLEKSKDKSKEKADKSRDKD